VAINMTWDDDYLGFVQSEKLFTQMVMDLENFNTQRFLFIIDRTILERMCKLSKMQNKSTKKLERIIEVVNRYSFATVSNTWDWTIGKYEIK